MKENFWNKINKPIMALAPMANVTDAPFRRIIAKHGKPDVMWTEFVSADGLVSKGRDILLNDLKFDDSERPIVAQLFSADVKKMLEAAKLVRELGFDGLDINMGCPDKSIEKQGAGAALIKNPKLAREIIQAAKEGSGLPVSVKTRIGYNKNEIDSWIPELLSEKLAALTIHARTRKEMSKVPARWEHINEVVKIRDNMKVDTLILGNGDLVDMDDANKKAKLYSADGAMLGRAIFGNPWLFSKHIPSTGEKLEVMLEHTKLFEKLLGGIKSFSIMKKHYKAYVNGFDGAKELRIKLMEANNYYDVEQEVSKFLDK